MTKTQPKSIIEYCALEKLKNISGIIIQVDHLPHNAGLFCLVEYVATDDYLESMPLSAK